MTLREWRESQGLSLRAAAPLFEVSAARLWYLEQKRANPTGKTMDRIEKITGGEVTRLDWPEREEP